MADSSWKSSTKIVYDSEFILTKNVSRDYSADESFYCDNQCKRKSINIIYMYEKWIGLNAKYSCIPMHNNSHVCKHSVIVVASIR